MNHITIEFCEEDRARLDRLAAALDAVAAYVTKAQKQAPEEAEATPEPVTPPAEEKPTESTKTTTEETETSTTTEAPAAKEEAPAVPTVTLEQIQKKVMQLAVANDGAKKAQVREIINAYGAKVSDLKEQPDKWTEVWNKLSALESEG